MRRALAFSMCAAMLTACDKAPAPPAAPTPPSAPAASETLTYECRSPGMSRGTFLRFDDRGVLYQGGSVEHLQSTGDVIEFDPSGQASWTKPLDNGYESNSFNKTSGQWFVQERGMDGKVFAQTSYSCKPL